MLCAQVHERMHGVHKYMGVSRLQMHDRQRTRACQCTLANADERANARLPYTLASACSCASLGLKHSIPDCPKVNKLNTHARNTCTGNTSVSITRKQAQATQVLLSHATHAQATQVSLSHATQVFLSRYTFSLKKSSQEEWREGVWHVQGGRG